MFVDIYTVLANSPLNKFVGQNIKKKKKIHTSFLKFDLISGPSMLGHVWRHLLDD